MSDIDSIAVRRGAVSWVLRCMVFVCVWSAACAQATTYTSMHRGIFFAERPFGALAWIDAETRRAAKGREMIADLSARKCQSLPVRDIYWFLINHRNPAEVGNTGFFAARILELSSAGHKLADAALGDATVIQGAVRVHRNAGWVDGRGKTLGEGPSVTNRQISIAEFIKDHDDRALENGGRDEAKRLADLTNAVGVWHAKPELNADSSWLSRRLFAGEDHLRDPGTKVVLLSGRLMKFSAMEANDSGEPALFYVNNDGDFDTLWIGVAAPNFGIDSLHFTKILIGRPCDAP